MEVPFAPFTAKVDGTAAAVSPVEVPFASFAAGVDGTAAAVSPVKMMPFAPFAAGVAGGVVVAVSSVAGGAPSTPAVDDGMFAAETVMTAPFAGRDGENRVFFVPEGSNIE